MRTIEKENFIISPKMHKISLGTYYFSLLIVHTQPIVTSLWNMGQPSYRSKSIRLINRKKTYNTFFSKKTPLHPCAMKVAMKYPLMDFKIYMFGFT